jgi:hypothetical protein
MKRVLVVLVATILAVPLLVAGAQSDTKTARGTVTAISGDTLTVKVQDKEMSFTVDKDSNIIARGATTKTTAAQKEGKGGVALADLVKVGDGVEIRYHDMAGKLHAAEIRAGVAVGTGGLSSPSRSARGIVSAMAGGSLTIKSGAEELTFAVGANTRVVGSGVGTKTEAMKKEGKSPTIADLVGAGDDVSVTYREADGTKQASEVRIRSKAKTS